MPLKGAEGHIDRCLDHLLTERLLLGVYPEQAGTAIAIRGEAGCAPPGALVLGLGPAGEVTAATVTRAMTQATLVRALAAAEDDQQPADVGVSAVLVGANPHDGIPIQRSVVALVEGVLAAIHILSTSKRLSSSVRITSLEIVELYLARAEAALEGLKALSDLEARHGAGVKLEPLLKITERGGNQGGIPADYSKGAWLRLDIRAISHPRPPKGYRLLEMTSAARRARADRMQQPLEVATVDGLIADAVTRPSPNPQIVNTLYELLLPNELKPDLQQADNLLLLLEPDTAGYPWEALSPRRDDGEPDALALRAGFLRQFADPDTRDARFDVRRATGAQVLVIGNPPAGNAPDLPDAAEEAHTVQKLLSATNGDGAPFEVCSLIWDEDGPHAQGFPEVGDNESWTEILNGLYQHEWRIIHIAAHGAFDALHPDRSGLLIGPKRYLTAQTIGQLAAVPDLVFLNCCHSGRIEEGSARRADVHLLAASVAHELIAIGVRAVVAAGWSVDDAPAMAFATKLYTQMLVEGEGFGDAVRAARKEARSQSPSMTWAAYQCYGDPEFRLRTN
jgi:hypothetical protein